MARLVVVALVVVELPVMLKSPTMVDEDVPSPMIRLLVVALSPVLGCVQASYPVRKPRSLVNQESWIDDEA